jgi:hypothetical protein
MTAIWKPRHIPKNGILFVLAYFTQAILPSVPRTPKPPGTIMPSTSFKVSAAFLSVISVVSIQLIFTSQPSAMPQCSRALMIDA